MSIRFISEPIEVEHETPPALEKTPDCPDAFIWRGERFAIACNESKRVDFRRKGRMAHNMQPEHAAVASSRGSWGVGRFNFRVRTGCGRRFDLYYDRAPAASGGNRKGGWFLLHEIIGDEETR